MTLKFPIFPLIWQELQNVLPLIGIMVLRVMVVAQLPIPVVLEKETVTVVMTTHVVEVLYVAPITVRVILGLDLVLQTAAFGLPGFVILKVPNLFFNQNSTVSYLIGLALIWIIP